MPFRYTCTEPGFETAFIEFAEAWSVRQRRSMIDAVGEDYLALAREKITGIYLPAVEGEPLTTAADFTEANLDRLDVRLFTWLTTVSLKVLLDLADLGEAVRRRSYGISEGTPAA